MRQLAVNRATEATQQMMSVFPPLLRELLPKEGPEALRPKE